ALFLDGEILWSYETGINSGELMGADELEVESVRVSAGTAPLKLLRYGDYDFYSHITQSFFQGRL
ncbi:MAG: hypothetical protein LBH87_00580, partial [Coriobacteriales bacterium]|nr:hypothetical protein [Coriobacteriales bacterium]